MTTGYDTLRRTDLNTIATRLQDEQARSYDVVVPASKLMANRAGQLVAIDGFTELTADGVTVVDLPIAPSAVMLGQIADKTGIPESYVRRMHTDPAHHDLWSHNVNHWLDQAGDKRYLVRTLTGEPETLAGQPAFGRALLSDGYGIMDDLDVLLTALDAIRASGIRAEVRHCDLTENRMRIRVAAPDVAVLAPVLLDGYRSPFNGRRGDENPTVFAGFEISNSQVGLGRLICTPVLEVLVCENGLRMTKDAFGKNHVGTRLDEGQIRWSDATRDATRQLIRAQVGDIITNALDVDYVTKCVRELEGKAQVEIADAPATVERVAKQLRWSDVDQAAILNYFTRGGQTTAGGLMHAATAYAQVVPDPDRAAEIEESGIAVLDLVGGRR